MVWVLLVCMMAVSACAQVKARLLSKDESAALEGRLSPSLVPEIAGALRAEAAQEFLVEPAGGQSFRLAPVHYPWRDQGSNAVTDKCGVFIEYAGNEMQFLPTIGMGWLNVFKCRGLAAVGFVAGAAGMPPRILLLYTADTPQDIDNEPAVLDWSSSARRYIWNEKISLRLAEDGKANSIAEMKVALKRYAGQ